jgi:hypothetical protein
MLSGNYPQPQLDEIKYSPRIKSFPLGYLSSRPGGMTVQGLPIKKQRPSVSCAIMLLFVAEG